MSLCFISCVYFYFVEEEWLECFLVVNIIWVFGSVSGCEWVWEWRTGRSRLLVWIFGIKILFLTVKNNVVVFNVVEGDKVFWQNYQLISKTFEKLLFSSKFLSSSFLFCVFLSIIFFLLVAIKFYSTEMSDNNFICIYYSLENFIENMCTCACAYSYRWEKES